MRWSGSEGERKKQNDHDDEMLIMDNNDKRYVYPFHRKLTGQDFWLVVRQQQQQQTISIVYKQTNKSSPNTCNQRTEIKVFDPSQKNERFHSCTVEEWVHRVSRKSGQIYKLQVKKE